MATEDNTLSIHIDDMLQPWKGDLPGMLDRRTIRVLTTYSKTFFLLIREPNAERRTTFSWRWKTI